MTDQHLVPDPDHSSSASVFTGADVCELAGLTLLSGSVRPVFDQDVWILDGLADAHRMMGAVEKRWDFTAIANPSWRRMAKELMLALLAPTHEAVARLPHAHRERLSPRTCRKHLNSLIKWLSWLDEHRVRSLTEVTQLHCDQFLQHAFVKHDPNGNPTETVNRADARRLLHNDTLKTPDRVAGLLVLLYAQRIATITQLTVDDIHDDGDTVAITFGRVPVALPEPLAALVRELVATRKSSNIITAPDAKPWLFPGRRPGHPLGDDRLGQRLQRIGLQPRQDRSTTLFALATELPAAILARMLGINIKVAVTWQQAASGDWAAYAADISRRKH